MTTIKCIVIPVGWDEKANLISTALSTYDEEEYLIDSHDEEELRQSYYRRSRVI